MRTLKSTRRNPQKHEKYDIYCMKVYPNLHTHAHTHTKQKAKANHLLHMWPGKVGGGRKEAGGQGL